MVDVSLILQALAAIAGPAGLLILKEFRDWKRTNDQRVERNTEAAWGASDPHNQWPGTVRLSKINHELAEDNEERVEDVEVLLEYVESRVEDNEERVDALAGDA